MAEFPKQAKVVIVGLGGIVGSSIAHHLIELGWDDIVGLDKSAIPTDIGSTSHASDFCYTTGADKFTAYTTQYSQQFFSKGFQMPRSFRAGTPPFQTKADVDMPFGPWHGKPVPPCRRPYRRCGHRLVFKADVALKTGRIFDRPQRLRPLLRT